jgi:hypothetical protein
MSDKIKPIIDSTYPALMAGLCLTFLAISPDILKSKYLVFFVSTASLLFILSSFYVFVYSVNIEWGTKPSENKLTNNDKPLSWRIGKWTFFFGIVLLVIATLLVVYILWFSDFLYWLQSNFHGLFNSTNLIETNRTKI